MGTGKLSRWLENWLTSGFHIKKLLQVLLLGLLAVAAVFWRQNCTPAVTPVLLLINNYPLTAQDKAFFRETNPYGFLLGIPAHTNMSPLVLRQELEQVLGRKDFLFFIDQEGGLVNRMKQFDPSFRAPAPSFFGQIAQKDITKAEQEVYAYGVRTGRKLKELSIDVVFAPLAEASAGKDTYTRSRYFSEDPQIAKKLADRYAQGLAEGGVMPCYKHFFGSASSTDPHKSMQLIAWTLPEIRSYALPAFEQARRWPFIMTAHVFYPALDQRHISTYSSAFYQFLRKELSFEGIIITDALNMEAADGAVAEKVAWRMDRALGAGADVVIPFFNIDADAKWMTEQLNYIKRKYSRRFQRKIKRLQQQGNYLPQQKTAEK